MFYQDKYYWEEGFLEIFPGRERIFQIGDRVRTFHKGKKYSGVVAQVRKFGKQKAYFPHPEVYVKTDELVDSSPGAFYGGFGLLGESSLFWFEDEGDEVNLREPIMIDIPIEEMEIFKTLKPFLRRKLIKEYNGIPMEILWEKDIN